jgi:hypothetical protein
MLEHGVAVRVEPERYALALNDPLQQFEVPLSIFLFSEEGIGRYPGCIIDGKQQSQPGPSVLQPSMVTAINLEQHPGLRHPLPTLTVAWWSSLTRAG